jgi:hypothetical protein
MHLEVVLIPSGACIHLHLIFKVEARKKTRRARVDSSAITTAVVICASLDTQLLCFVLLSAIAIAVVNHPLFKSTMRMCTFTAFFS